MTAFSLHKAILIATCCAVPLATAKAAFEFIPPASAPAAAPMVGGVAPLSPAEQKKTQMSPAPASDVVGDALAAAQSQTQPQSLLPRAPSAPSVPAAPVAAAPVPVLPAPVAAPLPAAPEIPRYSLVPAQSAPLAAAPAPTMARTQADVRTSADQRPRSPSLSGTSIGAPVAQVPAVLAAAPAAPMVSHVVAEPAPIVSAAPIAPAAPSINMNPLGRGVSSQGAASGTGQLEQAMMSAGGGSSGRASMGGLPLPPSAPVSASHYADAVGFGRDLPMALAVSQIVPPDYAFTFATTVNPGDTVSWEGGKAWDQVLNDALRASNASAQINDAKKEILIVSGATAPSAAIVPAAYTPSYVPEMPRGPQASMMTPAPVSAAAAPAMPAEAAPAPSPKMKLAGIGGSAFDPKAKRLWEAPRGATLRTILSDWSLQAGVELFWSSDYDFPVESAIRLNGTFEDAVQTLLSGLRDAQPRPIGRLHPNLPEGPSVLVIETKHVIE